MAKIQHTIADIGWQPGRGKFPHRRAKGVFVEAFSQIHRQTPDTAERTPPQAFN
jgi:hypothetical protein